MNCETTKIKKRLFKVAYPQFGWAVIYWCAYASLKILFNKFQTLKISDLFLQIIFGHTVNSSMWFQFVLIVLTIIFFLIFKLGSEKKGILTLHILLLISFAIEYSGLNYFLFYNLPNSVKYPLEGFFPMIPYAILGFDFAYFKIFCNYSAPKIPGIMQEFQQRQVLQLQRRLSHAFLLSPYKNGF